MTKEQLKEQKLREREQKKKEREAEKLEKELQKLKEAQEAEDAENPTGPDGFTGKSFGGLPVLDLRSSKIGKSGTINRLPDLSDPRDDPSRVVYVQYDSDGDTNTNWEDTVHPSIEYIEANGVMMFHLDYEQNRQEICHDEWPAKGMS